MWGSGYGGLFGRRGGVDGGGGCQTVSRIGNPC